MTKPRHFPLLGLAGGTLVLGLLALSVVMPNLVRSPRSRILAIGSNLRQLDGAMQTWAIDHRKTGAVDITEQDLAPYLRESFKPIAGERYMFSTLTRPPEAYLTRKLEGHPKGTVLRLNTNGTVLAFSPLILRAN